MTIRNTTGRCNACNRAARHCVCSTDAALLRNERQQHSAALAKIDRLQRLVDNLSAQVGEIGDIRAENARCRAWHREDLRAITRLENAARKAVTS